MPYTIRKVPKKPCYRLKNTKTKRVFAKCTTLALAKRQLRLLNAIKYDKTFVPRAKLGGNNTTQKRRR